MKPPLIVEFVGLPGAGKTTIANEVIARLATAGLNCASKSDLTGSFKTYQRWTKLMHYALYSVEDPGLFTAALLYGFHVKPLNIESMRRSIGLIRKSHLYQDYVAQHGSYDIILLDQGLIQDIWSVGITGYRPGEKYLVRLVNAIAWHSPYMVVKFDIDVETSGTRIGERTTMASRFDRVGPDTRIQMLSKHKTALGVITGLVRKVGKARFHRVDAKCSIEDNAGSISSHILHRLNA